MPTDRSSFSTAERKLTEAELVRFYRAIGIPAVASATQAAKMAQPHGGAGRQMPAFLQDAHRLG